MNFRYYYIADPNCYLAYSRIVVTLLNGEEEFDGLNAGFLHLMLALGWFLPSKAMSPLTSVKDHDYDPETRTFRISFLIPNLRTVLNHWTGLEQCVLEIEQIRNWVQCLVDQVDHDNAARDEARSHVNMTGEELHGLVRVLKATFGSECC